MLRNLFSVSSGHLASSVCKVDLRLSSAMMGLISNDELEVRLFKPLDSSGPDESLPGSDHTDVVSIRTSSNHEQLTSDDASKL